MIWLLIAALLLQESNVDRPTLVREDFYTIRIAPDGKERLGQGGSVAPADFFSGERHFANEEFQKNVDLTPTQIADLKLVLERANDFREEFGKKHDLYLGISSDAVKEYWKFGDQIAADAKDILLSHQFDRAGELVRFAELRQGGPLGFISKHAAEIALEVTIQERERLLSLCESLSKKADAELERLAKTTQAKVTSSMSPQQKELFDQQCQEAALLSDHLFAEVEYFKKNPKNEKPGDSLIETFRDRVTLTWDSIELRWVRRSGRIASWNAVTMICQLAGSDKSLPIADFTDLQREQLNALSQEIFRRLHEFNKSNPIPQGKEAQEEFNEHYKEWTSALDQYAQDTLDDILLPHQTDAFAQYYERQQFARLGPIARLMRGHFDELLGLDQAQKNEIQQGIETAIDDLDCSLLELERSLQREMIEGLEPENKIKFQTFVGDEPKHGHGSLALVRKSVEKPKDFLSEPNKTTAPSSVQSAER
jgi:hypothetical protein